MTVKVAALAALPEFRPHCVTAGGANLVDGGAVFVELAAR